MQGVKVNQEEEEGGGGEILTSRAKEVENDRIETENRDREWHDK